jgi:hypothetical protein
VIQFRRISALLAGVWLGAAVLTDIAALTRPPVDELGSGDPAVSTFRTLHGLYSGLDILKLLVAAVLGFQLVRREAHS